MKFNFPTVINEEPTEEWVLSFLPEDLPENQYFKWKSLAMKISTWTYVRIRLAEAQNWKCCWCGCDTVPETKLSITATVEHVLPKSLGGSDDVENLASSCSKCNNKRENHYDENLVN